MSEELLFKESGSNICLRNEINREKKGMAPSSGDDTGDYEVEKKRRRKFSRFITKKSGANPVASYSGLQFEGFLASTTSAENLHQPTSTILTFDSFRPTHSVSFLASYMY